MLSLVRVRESNNVLQALQTNKKCSSNSETKEMFYDV